MNEVFLKVVNMSISASWLVLAVLALRFLLKKAPKWVNVLLWGIVAVRLVLPFSIESALSLIPSAETVPLNIESAPAPTISSGVYFLNSTVNPVLSESLAPGPTDSANPLETWVSLISILWIVGIAVMLFYTAISYLSLRAKIGTAVLYEDNIFRSENVSSPFVLGLVKPKIYLPFNMDRRELEYVVAHEKAHIRRKDHWWKPLGFMLLTIHWLNPLMWLAYILLCRDIELACDEKVIKELGSEQRADYTQTLVSGSVRRRSIAACPLAFGEVGVKERVKSVMNYKKPGFRIVLAALVTCIVLTVCFLTNPPGEEPDLSFLNYKNAVSLVAEMDEVTVINRPESYKPSPSSIQIGVANGADLARQIDDWEWKECRTPREALESPGSVQFVIWEDFRITLHQKKPGAWCQYAVVKFQDEERYYRIERNDYSEALALINPHGAPFKSVYEPTPLEQRREIFDNEDFLIYLWHAETVDGDWVCGSNIYKYRLELSGRSEHDSGGSAYIVLSNTTDITYERARKAHGNSVDDEDNFDPAVAVIVAFKIINPAYTAVYVPTPSELLVDRLNNEEFTISKTHYATGGGGWFCDGYTYKYRLLIRGRMHSAAKDSTFIVLSNTEDISFEQASKAFGHSSDINDYFDPAEAVIVGFGLNDKGAPDIVPVARELIDSASFDIDGDGKIEDCMIFHGGPSGTFTFSFLVSDGGKVEYFNTFSAESVSLSFVKQGKDTKLKGVALWSENTYIFDISVQGGNIVLSQDGEALKYWGDQDPGNPDKTPLTIVSNGERVVPYLSVAWSQTWNGSEWLCADGLSIAYTLPNIAQDLPLVTRDKDYEHIYGEKASFTSLSVFGENYECLEYEAARSKLNELSSGTYYICVKVTVRGDYIGKENGHSYGYESTCYQCVFKLIVP